jgi:hypothetical protein
VTAANSRSCLSRGERGAGEGLPAELSRGAGGAHPLPLAKGNPSELAGCQVLAFADHGAELR